MYTYTVRRARGRSVNVVRVYDYCMISSDDGAPRLEKKRKKSSASAHPGGGFPVQVKYTGSAYVALELALSS